MRGCASIHALTCSSATAERECGSAVRRTEREQHTGSGQQQDCPAVHGKARRNMHVEELWISPPFAMDGPSARAEAR